MSLAIVTSKTCDREDVEPMTLGDVVRELRELRRAIAASSAAALNRADAAAYLSISVANLDRLASAGKLKPVRVSEGRVAWRRADLDAYLEHCE